MIVGTAGHIDHGKTALVAALTGTNTDRLPEEKKRGISIELGYAFLDDANGERIGFVDVPGHEKLVRTMVAGACGIDLALLLVAADDGAKPQTLEHLTILSLLGVSRGAALLTKIDRVDADTLALRERELAALLQGTALANFPVMHVSAKRGDGMVQLRQWLLHESQQSTASTTAPAAPSQGFRLGIDRAFSLEGIGTVVTGSIAAGIVRVGDSLVLAHQPDTAYRVRSLHAQNRMVQTAHAGQRCAVGLVGLAKEQVRRGHSLCGAHIALTSERFDVRLQVAASEARPLRSGTTVHLHMATQEVMASVAVLGASSIAPGEAGWVQLVARQPLALWQGERLILRDASASRTIAGGSVVDPLAPARYRQTPERLVMLNALHEHDPLARFAAVLALSPHGVPGAAWLRSQGLASWPFQPADLPDTIWDADTQWSIARDFLQLSTTAVLAAFQSFHTHYPDDLGPDSARARRLALPKMPQGPWQALLDTLVRDAKLTRRNGFYALPAHGTQLREAEKIIAQRALPMLEQGGFEPPWVRDIAGTARLPEVQVRAVLARLAKAGEVFQVVKDLYYHPKSVRRLAALAREVGERDGDVKAASFRDATGLGRKRAIQILEFFDRVGYLRRFGEVHLLRTDTSLFSQDSA